MKAFNFKLKWSDYFCTTKAVDLNYFIFVKISSVAI